MLHPVPKHSLKTSHKSSVIYINIALNPPSSLFPNRNSFPSILSSEHFSVSIFFSYKSPLPAYLSLKDRNHDVGWHDKWVPPLSFKPLQSLIVILRRQFLPHPLPELTQSCSVSSQSTFSLVRCSQIMFALLCSSNMLRFFLLQDFHTSCSLS